MSCENLSITPRQPKSGEQLAQMAPMAVVASIAMTVCGMFGMIETTRSPGTTPSSRSRLARIRTWPANSSHGSPASGVASLRYSSASAPGRSLRSTCSA